MGRVLGADGCWWDSSGVGNAPARQKPGLPRTSGHSPQVGGCWEEATGWDFAGLAASLKAFSLEKIWLVQFGHFLWSFRNLIDYFNHPLRVER